MVPQSLKTCLGFVRLSISNLGRLQQSTLPHLRKQNLSAAVAVNVPKQSLLQKWGVAAASITSTLKPVFNSVMTSPATGTIPALSSSVATGLCQGASSSGLLYSSIRSIMRIHFPRPRERKRIANHGYQARMKTPSQRRIIMRRILKGRHSLWHA